MTYKANLTDEQNEKIRSVDEKIHDYFVKATPDMNEPADMVNNPPHYKRLKHEPIEVIEDWVKELDAVKAFKVGNALKYIARFSEKGGSEDIGKAIWYLKRIYNA